MKKEWRDRVRSESAFAGIPRLATNDTPLLPPAPKGVFRSPGLNGIAGINFLLRMILMMAASLLIYSCSKDDTTDPNLVFSKIPAIEFQSLSPATINQLVDSLQFVIKYTDGDGDLGDYDADTLSLWITDNRFPLTQKFHIIPLAPQGAVLSISGILNVTLDHIILKDQSAASESATFTVKLKDRAGNWSNEVTSVPVTILP